MTLLRQENKHRPWYRWAYPLLPVSLEGKTLLDIGGGASETSQYISHRGARVTLIDIDPNNVQHAREKGIEATVWDVNQPLTWIQSNSIDGILLLDVIEHIWQTEVLMAELERILRPDGFILLTTPNIAHLNKRIQSLLGAPPFDEGYHCRFFTVRTISDLVDHHKLRVANVHHATSTLGINRIRRWFRKPPITLPIPFWAQNLLVRHIVLYLTKQTHRQDT